MINQVVDNLVTGKYPIFCHQVNCKGVMGSGIARQIREKYPEVYTSYHEYVMECLRTGDPVLGAMLPVATKDGRICVNLFGQYSFGTDRQYTNYEALEKSLSLLADWLKANNIKDDIAFPVGIGCGRAGGNWQYVLRLLKSFENQIDQNVILVALESY